MNNKTKHNNTMNWKEDYKRKVSKPEDAIYDIRDGQCVVMGHAAAAPRLIQQTLADHCEDYNDVLIFHMTTLGDNPCYKPCSSAQRCILCKSLRPLHYRAT